MLPHFYPFRVRVSQNPFLHRVCVIKEGTVQILRFQIQLTFVVVGLSVDE